MSCDGCVKRAIRGFLIPSGYVQNDNGDWVGPRGQVIPGERLRDDTTRMTLGVVWDKIKGWVNE